jgi:hypothetical protein
MRTLPLLVASLFAVLLAAAATGAPTSRYAGTYTTTRPGADSTQALTLVLDGKHRATLTTRFPDLERLYGPGVLPVRESGSWRNRGATAEVHFTSIALLRDGRPQKARKDDKVIGFALQHCRLTAVRYSKLLYGEAGLTFDRAGCRR